MATATSAEPAPPAGPVEPQSPGQRPNVPTWPATVPSGAARPTHDRRQRVGAGENFLYAIKGGSLRSPPRPPRHAGRAIRSGPSPRTPTAAESDQAHDILRQTH